MTELLYNTLWHFTEKLTRDPDDRQELVLMAWKESERIGGKNDVPWLINVMKLRSREMGKRCALGAKISGKSQRDAWYHEKVSINNSRRGKGQFELEDTSGSISMNPLSTCIVNDFENALTGVEQSVAEGIISGYNHGEISRTLGLSRDKYQQVKDCVREKALEYLA